MNVLSNPMIGGIGTTGMGITPGLPVPSPSNTGAIGSPAATDTSQLSNLADEAGEGGNVGPLLAMLGGMGAANPATAGAQQDPTQILLQELQLLDQELQQQQQSGDQQGAQQTEAQIQQVQAELQALLDPSQGGAGTDGGAEGGAPVSSGDGGGGGAPGAPVSNGGGGGGGGGGGSVPGVSGGGGGTPIAASSGMTVAPGPPPPASDPAWNVAQDMSKYQYQFYYNSQKSVGQTESQQAGNCADLAKAAQAQFAQEGIQANIVHGNVDCKSGYNGGHYWLEYQDPTTHKETFFDPTAAATHHSASAAFTGLDGTYSG